jgi:hypothetical protein
LIGLQVGIRLGQGKQSAERAAEDRLRAGQLLHRRGIARLGRRRLQAAHGLIAGRDHRFERLTLVLHIALDRLDQVGNQVVSPL